MGSKYYNPGTVNVEAATQGILNVGGGINVQDKGDYKHVSVFSTTEDRHLSYDKYPDGHYENVHTDKFDDDKGVATGYTTYGGGK